MPKYDRQKCTFPWERCRSTPTSLRTPIWEVHIGVHNTNGCSIGSARRPLCREDRHTDTRTDAPLNSLPTTIAGLMPTEARGNYLPEPPYLRETKTYHSQPFESIRHAGNYFVPLSIRPIFIFCCRSYVKLLDYCRRAEKNSLLRRPP